MFTRRPFCAAFLGLLLGCMAVTRTASSAAAAGQPASAGSNAREIVILYTNDFHAALDPIAAYWLPGQPRIGGAAALAGYVNRFRSANDRVFLFDSGDMFSGLVSNATGGEALMEMMRAMRYDAMAIGHREFDYGAATLEAQMMRVPMPVLSANVFHHGTRHRFARPYVIVERNGVRIGVIGVTGLDARAAIPADRVAGLDFEDPAAAIAPLVRDLRPHVDLIVLLAHQGKLGPQQTDAESQRGLQRDFDTDVRLAGAVPGIDVLIGGHAHRGIERPFVHPDTGTLIVQTYGHGTRLGVLRLQLRDGRVASHTGELVTTWTARVTPDPDVARVVDRYKHDVAFKAGAPILTLSRRVYRADGGESPLGNVVTDAMREATSADFAMQHATGLQADLPDEPITPGHVAAVLPLDYTVETHRLTGLQILEVLEQSLTLEYGVMQVSGLRVTYDPAQPAGSRVLEVLVGDVPLVRERPYTIATNSFVGQGGDGYTTFTAATRISTGDPITAVVTRYLSRVGATAIEPASPFVPSRIVAQPRP